MNASARHFAEANHLYQEVAERLFEHLAPINIEPQRILDLGAGSGTLLTGLQQRFRKADIINVDHAEQRLAMIENHGLFKKSPQRVCADACHLPFVDGYFDIVIANLMVHWLPDLTAWLAEMKRVLADNGLLIFSYFGPDSLRELGQPRHPFHDMHDLGDALVRAGLTHPILDSEHLTVEYDSVEDAHADLSANGEIALLQLMDLPPQEIDVTYEIVYGHAWKAQQPMTSKIDQDGMVRIDIGQIQRR
jgi:malonyl-CoA O-methyltransferase